MQASSQGSECISFATFDGTHEAYRRFWKSWCDERCDHVDVPVSPPSHLLLQLPESSESVSDLPKNSELFLSPFGLGTHYLDSSVASKEAVKNALSYGINVVDTAPNYGGNGGAEKAIGDALREMSPKISRSSVVLISKVGNAVGADAISRCTQIAGRENMLSQSADDSAFHCVHPKWIDSEIQGTLRRLGVDCLDVLLLHNPDTQLQLMGYYRSDDNGGNAQEIEQKFYGNTLGQAFAELERQRELGRIQCYGLSGAFYPLRPSEPQHMILSKVMNVAGPGFKVLQFPFNFAEPEAMLQPHLERRPDGGAIPKPGVNIFDVAPLVETAQQNGLFILTNRPLNGIYREARGACRFASELPITSALQLEDVDQLESKLSKHMEMPTLSAGPEDDEEGDDPNVTGQLAGKTLLAISSLQMGTVLCGLRTPEYLHSAWAVLLNKKFAMKERSSSRDKTPRKSEALEAVRTVHRSVSMWLVMAAEEGDDRGTAKDWRLPQRGSKL